MIALQVYEQWDNTIFLLFHVIFPVTPMDYGSLSSITLSFGACDTRHCQMIPIVDDSTLEQEETFSVELESTDDLHTRISLIRTNGQITIIDNDGRT